MFRKITGIVSLLSILASIPASAQQQPAMTPSQSIHQAENYLAQALSMMAQLGIERESLLASVQQMGQQIAGLTKERDDLKAQLAAMTKERDDLKAAPACASVPVAPK